MSEQVRPLDEGQAFRVRCIEAASAVLTRKRKARLRRGKARFLKSPMSRVETYHFAVFQQLSAITNCLTRLGQVQRILRNYNRRLLKGTDPVSRYEWLALHYSLHVLTLVSAYDVALQLVNVVMTIGLPLRQCRRETVAENVNVASTRVGAALKRIEGIRARHVEVRHLFIHRGQVAEPEARLNSEMLRFLALEEFVEASKPEKVPSGHTSRVFQLERPRLLREMAKDREQLASAADELFAALNKEYEARVRN
jgi:hypothetical protein